MTMTLLLSSAVCGLTTLIIVLCNLSAAQADKLCYACNSYMAQCHHPTLAAGTSNVFQARCSSKCFTRQGEDDAIYRGCFDAFKAVKQLTDNYVGCRNQTWNNRVRRWCLCDTDLCNTQAIGDDKYAAQPQYSRTTAGSGVSSSSSSSSVGGVIGSSSSGPITTHHTHHVVVQQHSYPAPPLPTSYVDFHSPKQAPPRLPEEGNATVARPTERYQANPLNPAEYRTVWNNWHVDLSGVDRIQTTTKTASDLSSGPVDVDEGWIDAPRGVLHSVHQDQQPTRNYGDRQYRLIRPDHRGQPQVAKSAETDPERHEIVEPISNTRTSVTENDTDPAARTRRSGLAEPVASVRETLSGRREEFERMMMTNKPRDVDQMAVVDQEANKRQREAPTVSPSQNADEQRQYQRPQQQQVLLQQQQQRSSSLDDGTLVLEEYGELADNGTEEAEVLEYPYNQEFSSHPVDWSPMEYIVEDVPSEYTPSPAMKQAPAEVADKADSFDSKDYPYNQYKERILADESYADYSESAGSLKEGGSEVEEHVTQPDEAVDKTLSIDYPYNQLFLIDGFANPTANDEDVNSTSFNLPPQPTKSSDTVRYTVHSDVKTPLSSSPSRHHEPHVKQGDDRRLRTDGDDVHVLPVPTAAADRQVPAGADRYIVHREQHGYEPHQDRHPLLPPSQTPPVLPTAAVPQPHPPEQRHHQQSDSADRPASGAGAVKEVLHTKSTVHRLPVSPLDAAPDAYQHVPVEVPRAAAAAEIAPLRTKDGFGGFPPHRRSGHGRDGDRKSRGPLAKEASDDGVDYEKVDEIISQYNPQHIVPHIRCVHTGYYQNPKDCTQFVACLFDHNTHTKVLHLMRCPSGLVWDNHHKLCMETSSTCREGLSQADLDNNYIQFFADVNAAAASSTSNGAENPSHESEQQVAPLNDIKSKHVVLDSSRSREDQL